MQVEQYVMAYGIEQDRIRAIIPEGFVSLRPVLRINAEFQDNSNGYLEFNTPVEKDNAGCYFLKETPELKKPTLNAPWASACSQLKTPRTPRSCCGPAPT